MVELTKTNPEIEYPLKWTYKVIGLDRAKISAAVASCINKEYNFSSSRVSSGGKYQSFTVEVIVKNENERLQIFKALSAHPAIVRIF